METYYISELQNAHSYREATKIEAKNLTQAKRKASRMQCFYGTVMEIGLSVNESGFILNPISRKINNKWVDVELY